MMTRTDKVKAYNALALNQRRREYRVGTDRWKQCCFELMTAMENLSPAASKFVNTEFFTTGTDWVSELSKL